MEAPVSLYFDAKLRQLYREAWSKRVLRYILHPIHRWSIPTGQDSGCSATSGPTGTSVLNHATAPSGASLYPSVQWGLLGVENLSGPFAGLLRLDSRQGNDEPDLNMRNLVKCAHLCSTRTMWKQAVPRLSEVLGAKAGLWRAPSTSQTHAGIHTDTHAHSACTHTPHLWPHTLPLCLHHVRNLVPSTATPSPKRKKKSEKPD